MIEKNAIVTSHVSQTSASISQEPEDSFILKLEGAVSFETVVNTGQGQSITRLRSLLCSENIGNRFFHHAGISL
jgi:hypothetical protein